MLPSIQQVLWKNFAASMDMLRDSITLYPEELWYLEKDFFYRAYHTLIFLDYYLTIPGTDFKPLLRYTITGKDQLPAEAIDDVIPNNHYSKQEMLTYLKAIREKGKGLITEASEEKLMGRWISAQEVTLHGLCPSTVVAYSLLEILFYNLRHIQHHVGQLNLLLRQHIQQAPGWISQAD